MVAEQIPGYVITTDASHMLQEQGYWGSYVSSSCVIAHEAMRMRYGHVHTTSEPGSQHRAPMITCLS